MPRLSRRPSRKPAARSRSSDRRGASGPLPFCTPPAPPHRAALRHPKPVHRTGFFVGTTGHPRAPRGGATGGHRRALRRATAGSTGGHCGGARGHGGHRRALREGQPRRATEGATAEVTKGHRRATAEGHHGAPEATAEGARGHGGGGTEATGGHRREREGTGDRPGPERWPPQTGPRSRRPFNRPRPPAGLTAPRSGRPQPWPAVPLASGCERVPGAPRQSRSPSCRRRSSQRDAGLIGAGSPVRSGRPAPGGGWWLVAGSGSPQSQHKKKPREPRG